MTDYRLRGEFRLLSPLSHIGEVISTTAYLSQEPILQPDGSIEEVFVYSGNAWRGQLRDLAAEYLLEHLGSPEISVDAFHLLFAGGRIGGQQTTNIEQARTMRKALPIISVWGGGIGNQILAGKLRVRNSYPVCQEAIVTLPEHLHEMARARPYRGMTFEKSYSRKDDSKDIRYSHLIAAPAGQAMLMDAEAGSKREPKGPPPEQMRMTVELLAPGAMLHTVIDLHDVSEIELGCVVSALHRFARSPHIGGQANRGLGLVELAYELIDLDSGETQDFCHADGNGRVRLEPPAAGALARYDEFVLAQYQAMIEARAGEMTQLLAGKGR